MVVGLLEIGIIVDGNVNLDEVIVDFLLQVEYDWCVWVMLVIDSVELVEVVFVVVDQQLKILLCQEIV